MADSNIQTLDTVKPITLDEYQERTAHLQENTTSLLSTIADRQVQAAGLATQAASLASEVNAVAEQASLSFSKKTWTDTATSGTPITAAELNRLENAISSLTTAVNNLQDSVSPKLLATTSGAATATIDVSGASLLVVLAKNNYAGITTATVLVAALSDRVETVHLAGGYRASGLHSNYDCRMSLTTFTGRDAYTNGTNRVSETQWAVYGLL